MSTTATPIQPDQNTANVVPPQAPAGSSTSAPTSAMGAKALLAKRMAKSANPSFVSPTDNMMTPVSQKLNAAKKKHFNKGPRAMPQLFASTPDSPQTTKATDDEENPF